MWSIGVITYILLGGYPPFDDDNQQRLFRKIRNAEYKFDPEYWSTVSAEAKDLIRQLLVVDSDKRLTAAAASKHPWVSMYVMYGYGIYVCIWVSMYIMYGYGIYVCIWVSMYVYGYG